MAEFVIRGLVKGGDYQGRVMTDWRVGAALLDEADSFVAWLYDASRVRGSAA
jgi:hypothetical protein